MSSPIVVTSDPAVTVAQDVPAITAVVPVTMTPPQPLQGISFSNSLAAAVDFNTLTTPGFYNTIDTASVNAPTFGQFWYLNVDVDGVNPTTFCRQIATQLSGGPVTYVRTIVAGIWGAWQQIVLLSSGGLLPAVDGSQLTNLPLLPRGLNGGRLAFTSSTQITFLPFKGNLIQINGLLQLIPNGGISITNASLANATLYYVYAFVNSGTLTLELSTTTHVTSGTIGNIGTEIKTGDDTRTLVGMIRTTSGGVFANSATQRFVNSWFNRIPIQAVMQGIAVNYSLTGATIEINTAIRVEFIVWADQALLINQSTTYFNNTAAVVVNFGTYMDGGGVGTLQNLTGDGTGAVRAGLALSYGLTSTAEGYHYVSLQGSISAGTGSLYGYNNSVFAT